MPWPPPLWLHSQRSVSVHSSLVSPAVENHPSTNPHRFSVCCSIGEVQGVIVAKRTMPKLFHLVSVYTQNSIAPTRPLSPSTNMNQLIAKDPLDSKDLRYIETTATVLMNITHIIFQMVPDSRCYCHFIGAI
jgi:hypothetical protein